MSVKRAIAATMLFVFALSQSALSQGFGGLGQTVEGFKSPRKGVDFQFPKDHGAHPDFRIEWWYLTANLRDEKGQDLGIQWTLFRSALKPKADTPEQPTWESSQLWMAHAAVTTQSQHFVEERLARGGTGQAVVTDAPFNAQIDDWSLRRGSTQPADEFDHLSLSANASNFSYELDLKASGPLVRHGENGYSVKSPKGQASYYYSQPFYQVEGTVILDGMETKVSGSAWLDREWSSQPLDKSQKGWDWVSLNLTGGEKIMGFRVRQDGQPAFTAATLIAENGKPTPLPNGALQMEPLRTSTAAGRSIPTGWRVKIPSQNIDITLEALNANSWMNTSIPYWEGPVIVSGSHQGRGYLEMTGY